MITSEWPTPEHPRAAPFIVRSVEFLRQSGHHVDIFHFRGGRRPRNYIRAWNELRRQLGGGQYDLLHAQWGQSGLPALPNALPLVVTFRGSDLEGIVGNNARYTMSGRVLRLASQIVAAFADEVIAVSETLARYLPRRDYHVIPSGINLDIFKPMPMQAARASLGLSDARLILFAASPQNPVKRYWLARAAIERIGMRDGERIELITTDDIAHDQMPMYMNACDVLLLTSRHEGSPNVVKEALACNLPIVSTDVGDVRMRLNGIAGCAVVGDSADELAAALASILPQNSRIDGRRAVVSLDERRLTDQIVDVYHQALSRKGGLRRLRSAFAFKHGQ